MVNMISCSEKNEEIEQDKKLRWDFMVVQWSLLANAGNVGSLLGLSRLHVLWGN